MQKHWVLVADQTKMAAINFFLHYTHIAVAHSLSYPIP